MKFLLLFIKDTFKIWFQLYVVEFTDKTKLACRTAIRLAINEIFITTITWHATVTFDINFEWNSC